jgi:hypothetical protein
MRTIKWLVGFAVAGTAAGLIASGCGGDDNVAPSQDSGSDHTTDQAAEASQEAAADTGADVACVPDADLASIMVPDASLGDSGATVPQCFACIQSTCGTEFTACNADCGCNSGVQAFVMCALDPTQNPVMCGTMLAGIDSTSMALGSCVAGPLLGGTGPGCLQACGYLPPAGEGGVDGATEGGSGEGGTGEGGGGEAGSEGGTDAASE